MHYKKVTPVSFRLPLETIKQLEYLSVTMKTGRAQIVVQLIKECHTKCSAIPPKEVVPSTPIIHAHAPTQDIDNISLRGLKGELSLKTDFFIDENGKEVPLPPSSPELDAKQKQIEADWKKDYEADLKRRGINP